MLLVRESRNIFQKITEFTNLLNLALLFIYVMTSQSRAEVARQAHYLKAAGSIPASATKTTKQKSLWE